MNPTKTPAIALPIAVWINAVFNFHAPNLSYFVTCCYGIFAFGKAPQWISEVHFYGLPPNLQLLLEVPWWLLKHLHLLPVWPAM